MDYQLPGLGSEEMTALMDAMPLPVLAFLPDGYLAWANVEAAKLLGIDRELLLGSRSVDLPLRGRRRDGDLLNGMEYQVVPRDGRVARTVVKAGVWELGRSGGAVALVVLMPVRREDSGVISLVHPRDHRAWVRVPARVDPGSGLLDRASIARALETEVSRSRRYSNPLSVLAVELAPGGGGRAPLERDALTTLGRVLQEETRWADSIGRWGARRVLMVLPETGAAAAEALADKLGRRLRATLGCQRVHFGLAQWRRGDDSTLLAGRAVAALDAGGTVPGPHRAARCAGG